MDAVRTGLIDMTQEGASWQLTDGLTALGNNDAVERDPVVISTDGGWRLTDSVRHGGCRGEWTGRVREMAAPGRRPSTAGAVPRTPFPRLQQHARLSVSRSLPFHSCSKISASQLSAFRFPRRQQHVRLLLSQSLPFPRLQIQGRQSVGYHLNTQQIYIAPRECRKMITSPLQGHTGG